MSGVPEIKTTPESSEPEEKQLDPKEADQVAEKEFKSKYPTSFGKRPSGMAQRKISAAGGKQYFDSGEYNRSASKKERQEISSLPHATDPKSTPLVPGGIPPHLAHMRARPKAPPSRLAAPAKSPLSD